MRKQRFMLTVLTAAVLATAMDAGAVAREVMVVNATGEPVANATVTITLPDGSTTEEETDDDGVLYFDFPEAGDYMIAFPGGTMSYSLPAGAVAAAGAGVPWGWLGFGALLAGTAVVLDDDGGSNRGGNSNPASGAGDAGGDAGAGDGGGGDDGGGGGGGGDGGSGDGGDGGDGQVSGDYNCAVSQITNEDGHPIDSLGGVYTVNANGSVVLAHSSGSTSFTMSGSLSGTSLSANGSGGFEGRSGAMLSFMGELPPLSGQLEVVCGACPDTDGDGTADPVRVNLTCSGPT